MPSIFSCGALRSSVLQTSKREGLAHALEYSYVQLGRKCAEFTTQVIRATESCGGVVATLSGSFIYVRRVTCRKLETRNSPVLQGLLGFRDVSKVFNHIFRRRVSEKPGTEEMLPR